MHKFKIIAPSNQHSIVFCSDKNVFLFGFKFVLLIVLPKNVRQQLHMYSLESVCSEETELTGDYLEVGRLRMERFLELRFAASYSTIHKIPIFQSNGVLR